jgi:hypothetical protein
VLLEGEAPPLDVVEQGHFERLHVRTEPVLKPETGVAVGLDHFYREKKIFFL